ncbi:MAG: RNA 3'-terminal phosphate cyclase [Polyangiaceae bacterium]|nr:RNA 3'-terminal phosphate cyclase [Polyangiaceae bacterium]NUQ76853.1 RNA 3'-terminal phosphate cyclase [Polyangiaceae bacterium]
MLTVDGSFGEGGGQILRTSLALALVAKAELRITNIRARRQKPGLMRQHLAAVRAAAEVGRADIKGAEIGSKEIVFRPSTVEPGDYTFRVGSAGSATLVLQTVLPAFLRASKPVHLTIEGGTHNPMAPPFDFLDRAFLPLIRRMGAGVSARLEARGYYPAGGGRFTATIEPAPSLHRLNLLERGEILEKRVVATVSNLPAQIAIRELDAARRVLGWEPEHFRPDIQRSGPGPGNVLTIDIMSEHVTEVFSGFGERGVRAETVGERAALEAKAYLDAGVPVGEHLADQLLLPMALAGGGSFKTFALSSHTTTHIELLQKLLGAKIHVEKAGENAFVVEVGG